MATKWKRAIEAGKRGEHEKAIPLYLGAMKLLPMLQNDPATWRTMQHNLGASYDHVAHSRWTSGRIHEAAAMQRLAVGYTRESALAYSNLGGYLMQQHALDASAPGAATHGGEVLAEAEKALRHAVALEPTQFAPHKLLLYRAFDRTLRRRYSPPPDAEIPSREETHRELARVIGEASAAARRTLCPPHGAAGQPGASSDAELGEAAAALTTNTSGVLGGWTSDWEQLAAARAALLSGRPHTIRDFFSNEVRRAPLRARALLIRPAASRTRPPLSWQVATKVHASLAAQAARMESAGQKAGAKGSVVLEEGGGWSCDPEGGVQQAEGGTFWMRRCAASDQATRAWAAEAVDTLQGAPMRRLVSALSGERCDGGTIATPTLFRAGDFLSLHNDAGLERRIAFAWHLHEGWARGDGGELAVLCAEEGGEKLIPPLFNSLTLFLAHGEAATSEHAVLPVVRGVARAGADADGSKGRRLAISGWFTQVRDEEQDRALAPEVGAPRPPRQIKYRLAPRE